MLALSVPHKPAIAEPPIADRLDDPKHNRGSHVFQTTGAAAAVLLNHGVDRVAEPTAGRVRARLRRDRTAWIAFCDAWDGYTWTRDKVITRPTLPELEDAVRQYADAVDQHAWVATGARHN